MRPSKRLAAIFPLVVALTTAPAQAVGPDLPIQIHVDVANELVVVRVDHEQIADVRAERLIYRDGDLVEKYGLELELRTSEEPSRHRGEKGKWAEARYNLRSLGKELVEFEPGAYAQKLVVTGGWRDREGELREERWLRYVVEKGRVRPLDLREYSNLVDIPEIATDARGRKTLVFLGGGPKEEVDARETKGAFDQRFGALGGLEPERVEKPRKEARDDSEREEN